MKASDGTSPELRSAYRPLLPSKPTVFARLLPLHTLPSCVLRKYANGLCLTAYSFTSGALPGLPESVAIGVRFVNEAGLVARYVVASVAVPLLALTLSVPLSGSDSWYDL